MQENICLQCRINNLARTESFWVFSPGFSSLINNISNIKQSNFDLHFLKTENCLSFRSDFDRPWSSKCFPIAECLCLPTRWCKCRLCTRHNLCLLSSRNINGIQCKIRLSRFLIRFLTFVQEIKVNFCSLQAAMLPSVGFICLRVAYREAFWEELSRLI